MRRVLRLPLLLGLVLLGGALVAACGGGDDDSADGGDSGGTASAPADGDAQEGGPVDVTLKEWAVEVGVGRVDAGDVTFTVSNGGAAPHEFVVIRTDLAVDALPTGGGIVDESKVEVVDRTETFGGGESRELKLDLPAGEYVLLCNLPGHYDLGMRVAMEIE